MDISIVYQWLIKSYLCGAQYTTANTNCIATVEFAIDAQGLNEIINIEYLANHSSIASVCI